MTETMTAPSGVLKLENAWLHVMRRYFSIIIPGNLLWEFAQMPLYTIWNEGTWGEMAFAAIHCTGGDILIATSTLVLALLVAGSDWPEGRRVYRTVAALTVVFGVAYTIFSEWLNIVMREAWAYSELMPVIPIIDAGLSPVLQWVIIPLAAFYWAQRAIFAE